MIKKMLLVFLCFTLFLSIPGCKKKLPTQTDTPTISRPTIESFTATPSSIKLEDYSVLAWSVTNATNCTIDHGVGTVSRSGTVEVTPVESTTYTLTATNSEGTRTASCTVYILAWAELDISLSPASPFFLWNPISGICISEFMIVMTETAGVGGSISNVLVTGWQYDVMFYSQYFSGGLFTAFGNFSCLISLVMNGQPTMIAFGISGVDANGYAIDLIYWFDVIWTQNTATMTLKKIVAGPSHHKLIK